MSYETEKHLRPMIRFVKNKYKNKPLIGAEIGVKGGLHSWCILNGLNIEKLYLIDNYNGKWNKYKNVMLKRLDSFISDKKVEIIYENSFTAHNNIPKGLDFLYIDGCHTSKCVRNDIYNYLSHLKSNSVIGGHDYDYKFQGLIDVVNEFVSDNNLVLHTQYDTKDPNTKITGTDWWVIWKK